MAITLLEMAVAQAVRLIRRELPELLVVAVAVPVLEPPVLVPVGLAARAAGTMPIHRLQTAPRRVRVAAVAAVAVPVLLLRAVLVVVPGVTVVAVAVAVLVVMAGVTAATARRVLSS